MSESFHFNSELIPSESFQLIEGKAHYNINLEGKISKFPGGKFSVRLLNETKEDAKLRDEANKSDWTKFTSHHAVTKNAPAESCGYIYQWGNVGEKTFEAKIWLNEVSYKNVKEMIQASYSGGKISASLECFGGAIGGLDYLPDNFLDLLEKANASETRFYTYIKDFSLNLCKSDA